MMIDNAAPPRRTSPASAVSGERTGGQFTIDLSKQTNAANDLEEALAGLKAEARKTPQERCRDQVMKEWHVTRKYIDSLPPNEAQTLNDRIEQEVLRRMQTAAPHSDRKPEETDESDSDGRANPPPSLEAFSTIQVLNARGATPLRSTESGPAHGS